MRQKPKKREPIMLFLSYAPEDEALQIQLEKHLSLLQRQGLISAWHNRQLLAGSDRAQKIDEQLNRAAIILLLISSDFLASDYCYGVEMQQALQRARRHEAYVIPILLRPVDWHDASFQDLPCLPGKNAPVTRWPDQDEAFLAIAAGIRAAAKQVCSAADHKHLPPLSIPTSPVVPAQPPHQVGIQSNAGGDITIEGSTVQIAAGDMYTVLPTKTPRELKARARLLASLEKTWIKDVYTHSLYQEVVLSLHLEEDAGAVYNPWLLEVQEVHPRSSASAAERSIIQIYDEALGSLLILGAPGSGKTTLLLQLLQELLHRARENTSEGIPVLFSLVSWTSQKRALADWLTEELKKKYAVSQETSKQWIESGTLIPLLDGLDEVAQEDRAACAQAIDAYREQYDLAPVVVCCRKTDYRTLIKRTKKLKLNQAVVIAPLTSQQIQHFLHRNEELIALRRVYQQDPVLQELAQTPLMLTILALTYHGKIQQDISLTGAVEDQRKQVFAAYIQRMFERRSNNVLYSSAQTIFWLSWLAKQLQAFNLTEFALDSINTDWLPKNLRPGYGFIWSLFQAFLWLIPLVLVSFPIALFLKIPLLSFPYALITFFLVFCIFVSAHYHQRENARQDQKSEKIREENQKKRAEAASNAWFMSTIAASSSNFGMASAYLAEARFIHRSDGYTPLINWLLQSQGVVPPRYDRFLDYATERIFLRKAGDRYMFIHRYLLEYFARLEYGDPPQA